MSGPDLKEVAHAVTLNEEQVKVEKETVPKERIRLDKDVSTRNEPVNEEVREEKNDVERDDR
jgi:stress response protein YsnF